MAGGQISFWCFTVVCVSLHPGFVLKANEGGMSDYGSHAKTFAFYTLALAVTAGFSLVAARNLAAFPRARGMVWVLRGYGTMLIVVLFSTYPYKLDTVLRDIHITFGVVLALVELAGSIWMYRRARSGRLDTAAFGVQLIGLFLFVLTASGLHLLFASQMTIAVGYGSLLVRSTRHLTGPDVRAVSTA